MTTDQEFSEKLNDYDKWLTLWQAGERYILIDKNESNLERWVYFVVANVERLIVLEPSHVIIYYFR